MPEGHEAGSVVGRFRQQATRSPELTAASDATESVSYQELLRRAGAIARLLRASRCRPGRPIAMSMSPTVTRLASMLGIMGFGSPYVPIDPNFPDSRIHSIVTSADVECIVVDSSTADRFASTPYRLVNADEYDPANGDDDSALIEPDSSDLAYIIYTSGSTGDPKGVAIEHGALTNLLRAYDEFLPPPRVDDAWLAAASVCFDMSVGELYWPLSRGTPVVIAELESLAGRSAQGAEFLTEALTGGRVTHVFLTPSVVQLMLRDPALAEAIRGMRVLLVGGEIVHPELVAQVRPVPHIYHVYGPTETTVITNAYECSGDEVGYLPIGRPLHGVEERVVDEEGNDCAYGEPGELLIAGPGLARGYVNDDELTAEKFPVLGEGPARRRWYRTGDLASMDRDGVVRYHSRIDSQVKVRGYRIELGEVEAAISDVPGVEEASVFPVRDRTGRVTGLIAAAKADSDEVSEAAILERIGHRLPGYAVPQQVRLLSDLPLAISGKVDRKSLERRLLASTPAEPRSAVRAGGSRQQVVTEVWREVLGPDRKFSAVDRFFDVGGDSALLGSVFARLAEAYPEANLKLVDLYRHPTVSAMAARLGAPASSSPPAADQAQRAAPPTSAAERRRLARQAK
jgi:amino acid adenylation domain-containing protein